VEEKSCILVTAMELTGQQLIGYNTSSLGKQHFQAFDPHAGSALMPNFYEATELEVALAVSKAEEAFDVYRLLPAKRRAEFLEAIAVALEALDHALIMRAELETALPFSRLQGERQRTVNQLRLFAQLILEGSWVDARIDTAQPERSPLPKSDIRQMSIPLGPVAVFGASNFPLAFSVAGGDTASALAAGCTVVVKAHPAHPGTSEMVGQAILKAAQMCNMPEGVFSLLQGGSYEVGTNLVKHPLIQAVGFTGSFKGGKALFDTANRRELPIPVFAEMGSVNPVFILPQALKEQGAQIAQGLSASLTLGVGQFCTKPGITFLPAVAGTDVFEETLKMAVSEKEAGVMLTDGIKQNFDQATDDLNKDPAAQTLAQGPVVEGALAVTAQVFKVGFEDFDARQDWWEEVFGPAGLLVTVDQKEQLLEAARKLPGHLTATIHGTSQDLEGYKDLLSILERKVGRLVINGFPTGVEVCSSMVHGGPYPATTAAHTTSVGTKAINRFVRPVCYQDVPQALLPDALKDENPLKIMRLINSEYSREAI